MQQDVKPIQVAVAQMAGSSLIAIQIEPHSRVIRRLTLQIERSCAGRNHALDQWIETHQLVVAELMAISNEMMAAPVRTVEQVGQTERLAGSFWNVIHAVIRDGNKDGLLGKRRLLDLSPDPTHELVQMAQC